LSSYLPTIQLLSLFPKMIVPIDPAGSIGA
jgi:hypothetical protein